VRSSPDDATYVKVERYSGATTSVLLNLQGDYLIENDRLFNGNLSAYLPIFKVNRGANMT
jgi:hypothetical protein